MTLLTYLQGLQPCLLSVTQRLSPPWQLLGIATGSHDNSQPRWHQSATMTSDSHDNKASCAGECPARLGMRAVAREKRKWANYESPGKGEGNVMNTGVFLPCPLPNSPHSSSRTSGKSKRTRQRTHEQRRGWKWGIRVEGLKRRRILLSLCY